MPSFAPPTAPTAEIHYDVEGVDDGFPVLLLAPGGMMSSNAIWSNAPWNPRLALAGEYRLIGMDQRNAGASTAPISASDSWASYAADQLDLLDHLGVAQCHVVGMCIGGPFALALMTAAPERIRSAVLLQPAGIAAEPTSDLHDMFEQWTAAKVDAHPEATPADFAAFGDNMWGGEFVLSVSREEAASCATPMLVMMGNDQYHPQSVSRELVDLAPNATLVEQWKDAESLPLTDATIKRFLAEQTP